MQINNLNLKKRKNIISFINNKYIQTLLYNPFSDYIIWSILHFVKIESKKMPNNSRILDAGAGELRYKSYFRHCDYISQDLCIGYKDWYFNEIDIKSGIYKIPLKKESFDYILCTQVLEHLEFPDKAFAEFNRLLKTGGILLLSAPLGFGEHQIPNDYFRFTRYGLKSLGERNKLKLISIKPNGGIFINLEYIMWQAINIFLPFQDILYFRYLYYFLFFPLKFVSGIVFVILDYCDRNKTYTNNYNCIYEKIS